MRFILMLILIVILFIASVLIFFTVTEYKPNDREAIAIEGDVDYVKSSLKKEESYSITTWNIGYAGLGKEADFFMDGGVMSRARSKNDVELHLSAIASDLNNFSTDFNILQEVDINSDRSFNINQKDFLYSKIENIVSSFSNNYNVKYVIVPFSKPMGKVESGLSFFSKYAISKSERYSLPGTYSWPTRIMQLKRAMLVSRIAIEGSDEELVIINTHNSVFDKGGYIRKEQLKFIEKFVYDEFSNGNYVIVGGDWNHVLPNVNEDLFSFTDSVASWSINMPTDFAPKFDWGVDIKAPTLRANNSTYVEGKNYLTVVDGFLVSPNVKIELVENKDLKFKDSDHNPVVMNFHLLKD